MNLLTNAIESIQVGIADYRDGTRSRLLSAIRNVHAGILLLYKEALRRRSPNGSNEALVKAKLKPVQRDGAVTFIGVGKRTADVWTIRERFEGLEIQTDWDRFSRISEIRNDIEHYYPAATPESIKELIASAFWLIRSFLAGELKEDPSTLLGKETWQTMVDVAEVFAAEKALCDAEMRKIDWESPALAEGVSLLRCKACGSALLRPLSTEANFEDTVLRCTVCSATVDADGFIPEAVAEALAFEKYLVLDDGAEEPYVDCPECGMSTYVVEEQRCARCGATVEETDCARCGSPIPASELSFAPLCAYCSHVMSKDD